MSKAPRQRLRPSLAGPDGRLDVPTLEERCAVLVINAKSVLSFYMDLRENGWKDDSLHEMMRNWSPFESYKVNQLLADGQYYRHHFIDVNEVLRSLHIDKDRQPEGFAEAMNMANCATFVHYIHQLPTNLRDYGELEDGRITADVLERAPLRNINELNDARRILLRWLLPPDWPITDAVLTMLLDMSTQVFIHRLQRNVEMVQSGELDEKRAKAITEKDLTELTSGEIVSHSLNRVMGLRGMTEGDVDRVRFRYETFANIRQIDIRERLYDFIEMRQVWSYQRMASDLTNYIRDVVREVDAGMHSTSLPQIMSRLERESSIESSELPESIQASEIIANGRLVDQQSVLSGPSQSTPKASRQGANLEPFASQFPNWYEEMLEQPEASRLSENELTESQRANAVVELLLEEEQVEDHLTERAASSVAPRIISSSSSVDLGIPSSPPTASYFRAKRSSGEPAMSTRKSAQRISDLANGTDDVLDSPAKEKASRLGFDSQLRLVQKPIDANRGRFDGSKDKTRESRFDSQGPEEEDVFLENATKKAKRGKPKANQEATPTAGPSRGAKSRQVKWEGQPQTPKRRSQRLTSKQPEEQVARTPTTARRITRSRVSPVVEVVVDQEELLAEAGQGRSTRARPRTTDANEVEDELPSVEAPAEASPAPEFETANLEIPLDDEFAGDDDDTVLARRAEVDLALSRRPARSGFENLPKPRPTLEFVPTPPLSGGEGRRLPSQTQDRKRKRIGPYRPGSDFDDTHIVEEEEEEEEEIEWPSKTPIQVQPYKRANLYVTGGNMLGRSTWTKEETQCLLDALYEVAKVKKIKPKFQVYSQILALHGKYGTRSHTLQRWNNVQLKDKSRNELLRMRRERQRIPYWKQLLHPNLWGPKKEPPPRIDLRGEEEEE